MGVASFRRVALRQIAGFDQSPIEGHALVWIKFSCLKHLRRLSLVEYQPTFQNEEEHQRNFCTRQMALASVIWRLFFT